VESPARCSLADRFGPVRSVVITRHGGPDVLQVQERPDPAPGPGHVLIDVRAAGINFADLMARLGVYPDAPKPPCVVGYEVAGTVAAVGHGVDRVAVGDRVAASTRFGGYAERVVTAADGAFGLPDAMSFEAGAAIPVNYSTAWEAIIRGGNVQPGERVLIQSAGGGVGIAATQLAKRAGAEVWGTASPGKHEAIRGFGVDHAVDYTASGWERGLPSFDLVMDAIGGASFRRSYKLLRAGGRLVCFGASAVVAGNERNVLAAAKTAVQMPWFSILRQMSASKTVIGLNVLTLWDEHGSGRWSGPLTELIESGAVRPVLARSFSFEEAGEAHRFIAERRNVGKVVLVP
jgi:NADPH:quinone reductase-like Zn-dependent oxidoreductase